MNNMNKKKINIAVIGTGFMGRTHSWNAANLNFFYEDLSFKPILHTICSRDKSKGEKIAEEWGFSNAETNLENILKNPEIDVIDICTPNIFHCETILQSLKYSKNIYCEKPLVISNREAEIVVKASVASQQEPICAVVFHNRFCPAILRAKQLITENKLGKIISFRCAYLHNSNIDPNKPAGWKQGAEYGGGVLFDLGSHAIDLVRFLCGEFSEISGTRQIFFEERIGFNGQKWKTNADEAFYMTARLIGGAIGTIEANKLATGANSDLSLEIYGEKGAIRYNLMQPNYLEFYDNCDKDGEYGGEKGFKKIECVQRYSKPAGIFPGVKAPIGWLRAHLHSYFLYLESVYNKKLNPLLPSFEDGAVVQNIMEKALISDKNYSKWEKIL